MASRTTIVLHGPAVVDSVQCAQVSQFCPFCQIGTILCMYVCTYVDVVLLM